MGESDEMEARIARAVAAAVRDQVVAIIDQRIGPKAAPRGITLRELFNACAAANGPPRPGAEPRIKSWVVRRNRLKPVVDYFGDEVAESLTPERWPKYVDKRLEDPVPYVGKGDPPRDPLLVRPTRTPAKLTINQELGWVKWLYTWGMKPEVNLVTVNPFKPVKPMKCRRRRETWITEDDVQRMISCYGPKQEHAQHITVGMLLLMIDQGFRFNEARRARRDRLRVHEGHVVIDVGRTKNGKIHYRALTMRTVEALGKMLPVVGSQFFFVNRNRLREDGTPILALYSERQMRRWFRDMCVAAGVDSRVAEGDVRVRPHDMRHSAATLALLRGADLRAIQAMLNHSSLAVTEGYLHGLDLEGAVEMAKRMEAGAAAERARSEERRRAPHRSPLDVDARTTRNSKSTTR